MTASGSPMGESICRPQCLKSSSISVFERRQVGALQHLPPSRADSFPTSPRPAARAQEPPLLDDEMVGFGQPREPRLVAAGHAPHDLEGRRAPGLVEIDERAVLVEQDALEGSWLERRGLEGSRHGVQPLISEKSATVRVASRRRERRRRRLARSAGIVGVDGDLVEERVDGRAKLRQRGHRALEVLARDMLAGAAFAGRRELRPAPSPPAGRARAGFAVAVRRRGRPSSPRCAGCWPRAWCRRAGSCRPRCRGTGPGPRRGGRP